MQIFYDVIRIVRLFYVSRRDLNKEIRLDDVFIEPLILKVRK